MRATQPLAVLVLLLFAAGCADSQTSNQPQASSIPDWSAPASYAFTLESTCGERSLIGQFRVVVEDGAVADAEGLDESGRALLEQGFGDEVPTLTELLDEAGAAAEEGAEVVDVQTAEGGRPARIEIDWDTNAIDDEACYRISDFTEDEPVTQVYDTTE